MAQLRVIAILAIATTASATPKGWKPDGELANAAATAAADSKAGVGVTGSEAWSDPARGCYAISLAIHGGAVPIEVAADQLLAALGKDDVHVHDVAKPPAGDRGTLALAFDARGYHGTLRADLASTGDVHAFACVWNQREPQACEAGCADLRGATK